MSHKTSRNRQRQVECAAEHFLRSLGCVNTVRAVKTRFQRQDLFACDAVGKVEGTGQFVGIQVTCGDSANVAARRRKLEAVEWNTTDCVLLGEFRTDRGRTSRYWFRMHQFDQQSRQWSVWADDVEFTAEWFKAFKHQP